MVSITVFMLRYKCEGIAAELRFVFINDFRVVSIVIFVFMGSG